MKGFTTTLEKETVQNENYRRVLYTSEFSQLVLMSLLPGEEIGRETHDGNDQFFRVESGIGSCVIDGHRYAIHNGDAIIVPRGAEHNIANVSESRPLKLYTIYSPPHHKDGLVRRTKTEAEQNSELFDGVTSEK